MIAPRTITPAEAQRLIRQGAVLVDVREPDEYHRERIEGATHCPLSNLEAAPITAETIIFHCASGMRTQSNAGSLAEKAGSREWFLLDGGLNGWKKSGLAVAKRKGAPIELQRQVMIAAGSLVLTGAVLAALVSPAFIALSMFVGAGLLFAGISGFCGMARLLMKAPWNRASSARA